MISDAYTECFDALGDVYRPKAIALLGRAREALINAGFTTDDEAQESYPEQYEWTLRAWPNVSGRVELGPVYVSVKMMEQLVTEEGGADDFGLNFSLDIQGDGGLIIGGLTPYNYTERVWVDARDDLAVAERWQMLEDADLTTIPSLILKES